MIALQDLFVVKFAPGMPSYSPDKEYILPIESIDETIKLQKNYKHQYIESVSQLYIAEEKLITMAQDAAGKKILVYGYYTSGDQMWYTALLREWRKIAEGVTFGVLGLKNSAGIWDGKDYVTDLQMPLDKETFDSYEHIVDLRAITPPFSQEDNRTHVQRYCEVLNIPYAPECDKPDIATSLNGQSLFAEKFGINLNKSYYVIQMHGQWDTHSFTADQLRGIAEKLDAPAFFIGFKERGEELWRQMMLFRPEAFDFYPCIYGSNIEGNTSLTVRELLTLVAGAKQVICPDSFLQHAAAAFDIPCVTVYGTHNPERLSANYKHNKSIYHKERCPASPCGAGFGFVPQDCPTRNFGVCGVVASVSSEEIMAEVSRETVK